MRRNLSSLATLMYPRVHECALASKVPLLYMGFVHCGGAFHTPTHYGTNSIVKHNKNLHTQVPTSFLPSLSPSLPPSFPPSLPLSLPPSYPPLPSGHLLLPESSSISLRQSLSRLMEDGDRRESLNQQLVTALTASR